MNALRQVSSPVNLWPAYGRRYNTVEAMRSDWEAGKDFSMRPGSGPYTSIRDLGMLQMDGSSVWLVTHDLSVRVA